MGAVIRTGFPHQCPVSQAGLPDESAPVVLLEPWHASALELGNLPHAAGRAISGVHGVALWHISAGMSETCIS